MLDHAAAAVGIDSNFRQVAVMVGIGLVRRAIQILAEGAELHIGSNRGRIRFVFFARQMGIPWRQAGTAGNPQAMHGRGIDIVILDQRQLAGGRILIQRQHGNRRRQLAVHRGLFLVARGVFELHHGKYGIALDAGHGGAVQLQQGRTIGAVREEMTFLARQRTVDDRLSVDIVITAGQHLAALAIRHHFTGHEEWLIGQLITLAGAVVELHFQAGRHAGGCHRRRIGQCRRRHMTERGTGKTAAVGAGRGAGTTGQQGRRTQRQRQQGCAGQQFQQMATLQLRLGLLIGRGAGMGKGCGIFH